MTTAYWKIHVGNLTAHKGDKENGFDADGVHVSCREWGRYHTVRKTPVASLGAGPVTHVVLKADVGVDLSTHYASAQVMPLAEMHTELNLVGNKWIDTDASS